MSNNEIVNIAKQAVSVVKRRNFKKFIPSFIIVKDSVRVLDGVTLIGACAVERTTIIQDIFSSADHNQLLANIVGGCIAFGVLNESKSYDLKSLRNFKKQLLTSTKAIAAGTAGVFLSLLALHTDTAHIIVGPLRWMIISGIGLAIARIIVTPLISKLDDVGMLAQRIAIVGINDVTNKFIVEAKTRSNECNVFGVYEDNLNEAKNLDDIFRLRGNIDQLIIDSKQTKFDSVIVTLPMHDRDRLNEICDKLYPIIADIQLCGESIALASSKDSLEEIGGNLVLTIQKRPLTEWQIFQKNIFDRVGGILILGVMSPILALTAILIKLDSKGPVFFKQPRVGYNNLMFNTYKFRSMYAHLEDITANQQTTKDDPRITRIGKYLRKYSIDELPQLINVVIGDMSLVGPRPHAPGTKAAGRLFTDVVPTYALRHKVRPGITGLAQISGWRGETKTIESIQKRVECDLEYIDNWSLLFDIKIIILTLIREIKSRNAF